MIIRELERPDDYAAAVALQRTVWGANYSDVVPTVLLSVAQKVGGLAAGAFDRDAKGVTGGLVGLIFGFAGVEDGVLFHWSDMMAVHPAYRDRGIGLRLKRYQRDALLARGFHEARWTFDPLEARNAFINFARLGGVADTYARDFYPLSDSPLHTGTATDRLIVRWLLDSPRVQQRLAMPAGDSNFASAAKSDSDRASAAAPAFAPVNARVQGDAVTPVGPDTSVTDNTIAIVIPNDSQALKQNDPALAQAWRANTRIAFEYYLAAGYVVTEFVRGIPAGAYILSRTDSL